MDLATVKQTAWEISQISGEIYTLAREIETGKVLGEDMPDELKTALRGKLQAKYNEFKQIVLRFKAEMG